MTRPLPPSEVHLWCEPLQPLPGAWTMLSPDERLRAGRFRFDRDRERFVAARSRLRAILVSYTGHDPVFTHGPCGKPAVAGIHFNLAHAGGLMLVAVAGDRPVGVDLEPIRPMDPRVAALFAPAERAALQAAPTPEAFCRCWVRKEAFIKALGCGLTVPLEGFGVTVSEPAAVTHTDWDPAEAGRWQMAGLEPAPGYVGAVVARGSDWALIRMEPACRHPGGEAGCCSPGAAGREHLPVYGR